jgi:hypothetical protein
MVEFDETNYTGNSDFNYDNEEGQDGMMETYSPHVDRVQEQYKKNPKTVWTIMDAESFDGQIIVAGYHHVNRFMYFISNEEWSDENEEYIWFNYEDFR